MNTFIVNDAQDHIELFSEKPFKCGMFQMFIKGDMEPSIAEQIPTKKFSSLREDCKPSSIRQEPLQTVSVDVIFDLFTQTVFFFIRRSFARLKSGKRCLHNFRGGQTLLK